MNTDMNRTTREAIGCFLTLVLGAIMCLGVMRIAILAISQRQRVDPPHWWRTTFLWVLAPAGLAFLAWLTSRFDSPPIGKKRG